MSQKLINHSSDLKKLKEDGYKLEIKDSYLIVHKIPYINSKKEIKYGELISALTLAGDKTVKPETHVIFFTGEYPCDNQGNPIESIRNESKNENIAGYDIQYSFSNKPNEGYKDYYEKITNYVRIISHPAQSIDSSVTATSRQSISKDKDMDNSVFQYKDTNSSKSNINNISMKLKDQKIAIIGLGGTGAYILDFVAKTPVREISLFDGDIFLNHNAFRTPGVASKENLNEKVKKTNYLKEVYSKMHKNIISYPYNIKSSKFNKLSEKSFVFICIDQGCVKKELFNFLINKEIPFIDVGMGLCNQDQKILGNVRTTLCTKDKKNHLDNRVSYSDGNNDPYSTNIQVAELNALNASLAVIKWKKINEFYFDCSKEYTTLYQIECNSLINEDKVDDQT